MSITELSRKGLRLFQSGKFKEALGVYKEGELIADTQMYRAFFCQNQAVAHTRLGNISKAKILLQKAYEDIKDDGMEYSDEGKLIAEAIWQIKQYEDGNISTLKLHPVVINDFSEDLESYEFEDSQAIYKASFNHSEGIVNITFRDGRSYDYNSISHELFQEFVSSDSKGNFFNQKISRRHFPIDNSSPESSPPDNDDGLFLPEPGSNNSSESFLPSPSYLSPEEKLRTEAAKGIPDSLYDYAISIKIKVMRSSSLPRYFENSYAAQEVAQLMKRAAEKGHTKAQYEYACMLQSGIGLNKSPGDAIYWFIQAGTSGSRMSQYFVGSAYEKGAGVDVNFTEAYAWYALASSNPKRNCYPSEIALESLLKLKRELYPLTIAQAELRFRELQQTTASHID